VALFFVSTDGAEAMSVSFLRLLLGVKCEV
jgi:hypothetical protein